MKTHILIVDDDALIREGLRLLLCPTYEVFEAVDGEEAIELLMLHPDIKLVITDYQMPKMDGIELIKWIRSPDAPDGYKDISVILSSADEKAERLAHDAGADLFILKGKPISYIRSRVEDLLAVS